MSQAQLALVLLALAVGAAGVLLALADLVPS